jgi:cobalt-zinc-cadmium efflux system outer membrane protein
MGDGRAMSVDRFTTPTAARSCGWLLAVLAGGAALAHAETAVVLDKRAVLALVARAPEVAIADARAAEARALRVGAGSLATTNPDLAVSGGPRRYANGERSTDVLLSLSWPVEISGARSARKGAAEAAVSVSEVEAADARRLIAAEAVALWAQARGAAERVEIARDRIRLDDELVRIAEVRLRAGVAGSSELALASTVAADGRARLQEATASQRAALALMAGKLGLSMAAPLATSGSLVDDPEPPSLDALIARLPRRPDAVRAERAVPARRLEATREGRLGVPVPRVMAVAGRENETFAHLGLDVPIPIYQRNQTNRAVADARVGTAEAQRDATLVAAEAELRAAHATYEGAREAWKVRSAALPAVADLEKLALRSYELGSMPLAFVVVSRREAATARAAHLEAAIAVALTRAALESAAGGLP